MPAPTQQTRPEPLWGERLRAAEPTRPHIVALVGRPGSGRTTLLRQLAAVHGSAYMISADGPATDLPDAPTYCANERAAGRRPLFLVDDAVSASLRGELPAVLDALTATAGLLVYVVAGREDISGPARGGGKGLWPHDLWVLSRTHDSMFTQRLAAAGEAAWLAAPVRSTPPTLPAVPVHLCEHCVGRAGHDTVPSWYWADTGRCTLCHEVNEVFDMALIRWYQGHGISATDVSLIDLPRRRGTVPPGVLSTKARIRTLEEMTELVAQIRAKVPQDITCHTGWPNEARG